MFRPTLICLLLALVTLAVFSPVRKYDFINLDDPEYITSNPHVQQGLTSKGVVWAFGIGHANNWHPLTWLSHMLDADLLGISPVGPHMVNLLFHAVNVVLLFLVLRGLTGTHWRSAFVAALFALHPLHVESVAWISERKDVLSTMFWLLTLGAYGRYVQRSVQGQALGLGWASRDYWLALLFFTLGLMSKPMLVTLPFVLLLLDYWPLNRVSSFRFQVSDGETAVGTRSAHYQLPTTWHLVWEKIPFFVLSAISCAVTLLAQSKGFIPVAGLPISVRIENALVSYARYLGKTFWPVDLALPYPYPGGWPSTGVILAVALFIAICAVAVWWKRRLPFLFVGWFWFLGTLVPVIGLIQVGTQSMADRYTYVPLIGIFIILSWGAEKAVARWHLPKLAAGIAGVLVLGICLMLTMRQLGYWRNTETLFRHTIAATENNVFAYDNLGYYLYQHGHPEEAFENYRRAVSIDPKDYMAYNNIGCYFYGLGRLDEAITNCQQALRLDPNNPNTLDNLGMVLACQKKYSEAIKCYEAALRLMPDYADAHNNLGAALNAVGRTAEAIRHYDQALRLVPDNAKAHNNLGNALITEGRVEEAIEHYRQAIKLNPDFVEALNNLALVLAATKQYTEASLYYQRALHLDPNNPKTHFFLGCVLVQRGRREEAVVQLKEALRLKPDYAEAKRELQMLKVPVTE